MVVFSRLSAFTHWQWQDPSIIEIEPQLPKTRMLICWTSNEFEAASETETQTEINANAGAANLPFEILRTIFLLATPLRQLRSPSSSTFRYKYALEPRLSRQPLSFTYVCSWWRSVALGIPELWNSLSATRDHTASMSYGIPKTWLKNAKISFDSRTDYGEKETSRLGHTHAFNFHLAPSSSTTDPTIKRYNLLTIRCLWQHISHCRSINLRMDKEMLMQFTDSLVFDAPLLEDVQIHVQTMTMTGLYNGERSIVSWLRRLPALRRLCLRLPFDTGDLQSAHLKLLPFHMLEEVHLKVDLNFEDTARALMGCISARTIRLIDLPWNTRHSLSINNPVALHDLTLLSLDSRKNPMVFLDYLELPALKVLILKNTFDDYYFNKDSLRTFLERSKCTLDKLVIHNKNSAMHAPEALVILLTDGVARVPIVDISFTLPHDSHLAVRRGQVDPFQLFSRLEFKTLRVLQKAREGSAAYHVGWGLDIRPDENLLYEI